LTLAELLRGQGKPEATGWSGGPVDDGIFGRYAELLRQAGEEVAPVLSRILGEVREWLERTPEAGEAAGVTAHSLAGSCSLIGARKLAAILKELSEMAEGTAPSRWNAGLAEAGEALREAEGYFAEAQTKAARN
jgi:HPt (histidine-containing phosphotransfer) domain-containing protein